jgi:alpha-ketoglutaric semialdehyde dehydrogenase
MEFLKAIIKGKSVFSSQDTFESKNPAALNEVLGTFANATKEDCREACRVAKQGFSKWKNTPSPVRGEIIANLGKLIAKNKEALSRVLSKEMGKPYREALGDVQEAIDTCHFFLSEGRRLYGQTVPSEMPEKELFTYRRPVGVFAFITAGNFPFAVPSWYFVPALLCGNTCVWKPSEDTPMLSKLMVELIHAAGVPTDVFQVVFGEGAKTGADLVSLVDEGLIDKVGFTGSTTVGKGIGEICGRNLQVPCLELGGKNPMVITPSADIALALHGAFWSGFGTGGQRCTSLGNLIVHESHYENFVAQLKAKIEAMHFGNPFNKDHLYGPLMSTRILQSHLSNLEKLVTSKHKMLTSQNGKVTKSNKPSWFEGDPENGHFAFPSVVTGVTQADEIYATETFGPLFNVMKYKTLDEAIALSNGTGFGLSSSIYTQDSKEAYIYKSEISAGMTSINNSTSGAEAHLPFGGNGKSGNGSRQSGIWVLDTFTRWQSVNWDMSGKLQLAQMETHYIEPKDLTVDVSFLKN